MIPLRASDHAAPLPRSAGLRVLAVAEGSQRRILTRWAEGGALALSVHSDAREAFAAAVTQRPDLIVLAMGDGTGLPLVGRIAGWRLGPLAVLLPSADIALTRAAFAAGAADVLTTDMAPDLARTLLAHAALRATLAPPQAGAPLTLVQETAEGMMLLDPSGIVRFANEAAAALLGTTPEALLDRPFPYRVVVGDPQRLDPSDGVPGPVELRFIETDWGGVPARLATLADLSARQALEAAGAPPPGARQAAVAGAVRTRLTTIIGFAELMLSGAAGPVSQPRHVQYLADIRAAGLSLLADFDSTPTAAR